MEEEKLEETLEPTEEEAEAETPVAEEEEESEPEAVSREEFEELKRKNEQLFARAKKAEEKVVKQPSTQKEGDEEFKPRVEFLLSNRDINAEEYDHLAAVAQRNSGKITFESLTDARKSESEYLSYLRKKVESKSKSPSSTSESVLQKTLKSSEDIAKMTSAEHQRYEESVMRAQNSGI